MPGYQTVKTEIMTAFQKGFTKSAKRFIDDHSSIYSHAESKHLNHTYTRTDSGRTHYQ